MKSGFGCLALFGALWTAMILMFDWTILSAMAQQVAALGYRVAEGRVISSELEIDSSGDSTSYRPKINYAYEVFEHPYRGTRYRYSAMSFAGRQEAQAAVDRFPVEEKIRVFYHPLNPADAILEPGVSAGDLFGLLFLVPFNAVMLGFWWAGIAYWFPKGPAGVPVVEERFATRVRIGLGSPFFAGIAAAGGTAFLMIFIVLFTFGTTSMLAAVMSLSTVAVVGIVAAAWQLNRNRDRDHDLVIDRGDMKVFVPAHRDRKNAITLPLGDVTNVDIETIEKTDSDGTTYSYAPRIHWTTSGIHGQVQIVEWHDEASAKKLVLWLREKFGLPKDG
jgi:hypothetical protein